MLYDVYIDGVSACVTAYEIDDLLLLSAHTLQHCNSPVTLKRTIAQAKSLTDFLYVNLFCRGGFQKLLHHLRALKVARHQQPAGFGVGHQLTVPLRKLGRDASIEIEGVLVKQFGRRAQTNER